MNSTRPGGRGRGQRPDERELTRRVGARLEPGDARGDERRRAEPGRERTVVARRAPPRASATAISTSLRTDALPHVERRRSGRPRSPPTAGRASRRRCRASGASDRRSARERRPCARDRRHVSARRARAAPARAPSTAASASRSRSPEERSRGWRAGELGEAELRERRAGAFVVGAERDLVEHALASRRGGPDPARGTPPRPCVDLALRPAASSPHAISASVVLPAPFGPVSATISPRATVERDTGRARASSPYENETPTHVGRRRLRRVRQIQRPVLGQPARSPRRAARRARCGRRSMKRTRSTCASGRAGRCSETTTAHVELLDAASKNASRRCRVELRGRLVEQEQPRLERERRRERRRAAARRPRARRRAALGELLGADRGQSASSTRAPDRPPARRRGSRARTRPRSRPAPSRSGPRDPGRPIATVPASSAGRVSRVSRPATTTRPAKRAAVEVRHEPGKRAQQRRLARARRPEQRDYARPPRSPATRRRSAGAHAGGYANVEMPSTAS